MDFLPLDIVLVAMVAGFLLFKLWQVLGRRTGHERPRDLFGPGQTPGEEKVVPMPTRPDARTASVKVPGSTGGTIAAPPGSPLAQALSDIRAVDRRFEVEHFVSGARAAHEMIASAFADGDRETLRPLLEDQVFASFDGAIRAREDAGHKMDFTYVRLKSADVVDAALRGRIAEVTVKFVSELMSATVNKSGETIEGDAASVRSVTDIWTFARDTRNSDPNWRLTATSSAN
jgi:predicted lipid-binding transport protein (Tim44 family)